MELICYLRENWALHIRPASATRDWMDATPQSFAYRCLPLNIANAHGWEILCPTGFEAVWNGDAAMAGITITPTDDGDPAHLPISLFGSGLLTFHVNGLFRTPPGWNLWAGGSPNQPKDGIAALTGVIETDWSPYSFTMNWRFTRPHHKIRFEAGEPLCFLFPVQRAALDMVRPRFEDMAREPEMLAHFRAWNASRNEFLAEMRKPESGALPPPPKPGRSAITAVRTWPISRSPSITWPNCACARSPPNPRRHLTRLRRLPSIPTPPASARSWLIWRPRSTQAHLPTKPVGPPWSAACAGSGSGNPKPTECSGPQSTAPTARKTAPAPHKSAA